MNTETAEAPVEAPALPIAEYNPVAAGLADLRQRFGSVAFDVATTKGNAEARAARQELVKLRTGLEAKRKELKAPALERARLIDTEAKRLTAEILALETPIDEQIKAEEQRKEAERTRRLEAEAARIAEIRARLDDLMQQSSGVAGMTSAQVKEQIALVAAVQVDRAQWAEFAQQAFDAQAAVLKRLRIVLSDTLAAEAESARLKAEREELERQRQEQEAERLREEARARAVREEEDRIRAEAFKAEQAQIAALHGEYLARVADLERQAQAEREAREAEDEFREAEDRRRLMERQQEQQRLAAEREALAEKQRALDEQEARQQAERDRLALEKHEREQAELIRQRDEALRIERLEREEAERQQREREEQRSRDAAQAESVAYLARVKLAELPSPIEALHRIYALARDRFGCPDDKWVRDEIEVIAIANIPAL